MPGIIKKNTVGDAVEYDDDSPLWCPRCWKRGKQNPMKGKILQAGIPEPYDYDLIKQCHVCYYTEDTHKLPKEGQLYSPIEIQTDPYDFDKAQVEEIKPVSSKKRFKDLKQNKGLDKVDKEIELEKKKGGVIINFQQS